MNPSATQSSRAGRLAFLDWLRGLAAVTMLNGHAFHAFTRTDLRNGGPYVLTQFIGGVPPAVFLFLVGVTLAFLMDSTQRKGLTAWQRVRKAAGRASYLFGIAFLFRLQLWIFGLPGQPWTDLFRVDVLNCMGFAVLLLSVMAVFSTADRIRLCAVLGLAIAALSPLVSLADWSGVPVLAKMYIAPDYQWFGFFPWAAFVAFGMSVGSILRSVKYEQYEKLAQWAAIAGFGMVIGGNYFAGIPYSIYPQSEFWLNSPWLVISKTGVVLLLLSFAFIWTRHNEGRWSWVRQFGMTSLLVYWVHIELVYGRWFWFWRANLSTTQVVACSAVLIVTMLFFSLARVQWRNWVRLSFYLSWYFLHMDRRVPVAAR